MNFSKFLLDLFFPKFCLFCKKEGSFLCQDCKSTFPFFLSHLKKRQGYLNDLYFALDYQDERVHFLIKKLKYPPFLKELAQELASFVLEHLEIVENKNRFSDFLVVPIPLEKERQRWRAFNQSEEIAKEIASFFHLPLENKLLIRIKKTLPQVELNKEERRKNLKDAFFVSRRIDGLKILLVDDVYTSGATMQEAARVLKENGARTVIGIVLAREF